MSVPLPVALALAKGAGALSKLRGGGATSVPGRVLVSLRGEAIAELAGKLPRGVAVISATNGKTTTATMAASIMQAAGIEVVHNGAGANMAGGVASSLLRAAEGARRIDGELGLFEIDEAWLHSLVGQLRPRAILLCNLFRDQLDRYGELEAIAQRWAQTVQAGNGPAAQLVLNADDPLVADLGRDRGSVLYYGIEDEGVSLSAVAHAADAKRCRRCGEAYRFERVYLGHLGLYSCPSCGRRRPQPQLLATDVELKGVDSCAFQLHTPLGSSSVQLPLPGLYNVYNALAAAALGVALGLELREIVSGLSETKAAFGRAEALTVQGRELKILLVKNPVGANEVLRTLALQPADLDLFAILNDKIADGRDVSWIWDADFEPLASRVRKATCAGTRAPELALRLKYAGVEPHRISVTQDLSAALLAAIADRPRDDPQAPLYALPTYTAMLDLRALLLRRGDAKERWS